MSSLAVEQIRDLSTPDGPIQLVSVSERGDYTVLTVSLDTRGIPHAPSGIRVRGREVFLFLVPPRFPFEPPYVEATHSRWAGTAHVQWGKHVCLYAAPSVEWNPADGIRGLIDRLVLWLERAALGSLDPEGQPLHPPIAYPTAEAGHMVVRANLGSLVPWAEPSPSPACVLLAWCVWRDGRCDVVEWLTRDQVIDRMLADGFAPRDEQGNPQFVAVTALISEQIAFEYPSEAAMLLAALERSGLSADMLLAEIAFARLVNNLLENALGDVAVPDIVALGTPSRRIEESPLAHLSAWRLDGLGGKIASILKAADYGALKEEHAEIYQLAKEWLQIAHTQWMRVWEDRPEVTRPRDGGTPVTWLQGRRVLLLGCGALGGPIAEYCVRAGVGQLTVVDKGRVGPGILSRQPYDDGDISKPKAQVLAQSLSRIRPELRVEAVAGDALELLAGDTVTTGFDLVIEASADVGVRTAVETHRARQRGQWPDVLTMMIGHDATRGVVAASARGASGGPVDVLRRFALTAHAEPRLKDIAEDFFPAEPREDLFFPEPGCSSPTFVGSRADVAHLSGALINAGIELLSAPDADPMGAAAVRRNSRTLPALQTLSWESDLVLDDANGSGFEVRLSQAALNEMRAEARRGRRIRGAKVETGGLMVGAFDEAIRVVNVDRAAGPPPDSVLSSMFFRHGTGGAQEFLDERRRATAGRQLFVGLWHTHPFGQARPSATDDEGMWELVTFHGVGRRALMIILGGEQWGDWLDVSATPSAYARVSKLGGERAPTPPTALALFAGPTFPGGYAYPPEFHSTPGRGRR